MIAYINYKFKPKGGVGGGGGTCILEPCSKSNNDIPIADPHSTLQRIKCHCPSPIVKSICSTP